MVAAFVQIFSGQSRSRKARMWSLRSFLTGLHALLGEENRPNEYHFDWLVESSLKKRTVATHAYFIPCADSIVSISGFLKALSSSANRPNSASLKRKGIIKKKKRGTSRFAVYIRASIRPDVMSIKIVIRSPGGLLVQRISRENLIQCL